MSAKDTKICKFLSQVGITPNSDFISGLTDKQKQHVVALCDRAAYLYNRIKFNEQKSKAKFLFERDEFRAIEWFLLEVGVIDKFNYIKCNLTSYDHYNNEASEQI